MKKNQVNNMFNKDVERRKNIIMFSSLIIFIFVISILSLIIYLTRRHVQYVKYNENSNVEYNVYLKNNEFYKEESLKANNQYISELIDHIAAEFKHNVILEKDGIEYRYAYRIVANVLVRDKVSHRDIYTYDDTLIKEKTFVTSKKHVLIDEKINVDYNKYNDLIQKFVQVYGLYETENVLRVNLYVDVIGNCEEEINSNESVTTLEIPLTNKTMGIDIKNNLVDTDDNVMLCIKPSKSNYLYIAISIIAFIMAVILIVKLVIYIINSRSAKTVYEKELKKILSNYRSYIQKINSKFTFAGYQLLKVDNFTDMLEIRDTTNQPILMVENADKDSAYFVIPTSTRILYVYSIKVSDIEKEMKDK